MSQLDQGLQIKSSASSRQGSLEGSQHGSIGPPEIKLSWEEHVRLCTGIRSLYDEQYKHNSEVQELRALLNKSTRAPGWLRDLESPEYRNYSKLRTASKDEAENLHKEISRRPYSAKLAFVFDDTDDDIALDVSESLPHILHIVCRTKKLQTRGVISSIESDYRQTMDSFGMMVWDTQSNEKLIYLAERTLQLPALSYHPSSARLDACTFISSPPEVPRADPLIFKALTCFPNDAGISLRCLFLHWVTGFRRAFNKDEAIRQVVEGLVSGLYQRRALGFTDHFVFGTAHHTRGILDVLAATWAPCSNSDELATSPPELRLQDDSPLETQRIPPSGDALVVTEAEAEDQPTTVDNLSVEDIMKRNQIVVYRVGQYSMGQAVDMLRLYLFMRQTRFLALKYQDMIYQHSASRIEKLSEEADDYYRWPPLPAGKPKSRDRSAAGSTVSKRRKMMKTTPEEEGTILDQSSDSDFGSDSDELASVSATQVKRVLSWAKLQNTIS